MSAPPMRARPRSAETRNVARGRDAGRRRRITSDTMPNRPKTPRLARRSFGAHVNRFSTVRAVARFKVCSGRLIRCPIWPTIAVSAAWDEAVAWKYSHTNHVVAYANVTRRANREASLRRARSSSDSFGRRGRSRPTAKDLTPARSPTTQIANRIPSRMRVDVGWETTSPTNRTALTVRQRVCRRQTTDRMRRRRMNPRDCGERWNCAQTANRAERTAPGAATEGGNVERRNAKIATNVRPPTTNGYIVRKDIAGTPAVVENIASTRNVPGQFAEYCPRFEAGR